MRTRKTQYHHLLRLNADDSWQVIKFPCMGLSVEDFVASMPHGFFFIKREGGWDYITSAGTRFAIYSNPQDLSTKQLSDLYREHQTIGAGLNRVA